MPEVAAPADVLALFHHAGFFVVRSALLPFAACARLSEAVRSDRPMTTHAERRSAQVAELAQAFAQSELREALFFASPRLDAAVDAGGVSEALVQPLANYLTRSSSRATPFGVFAGVSLGKIAAATRLELGPRRAYRRHTRPSLAFLAQLLSSAAAQASPSDGVRYEVTPSAYRACNLFRFSREGADGKSHPVVDVKVTPELERALACAASGASPSEIAQALAAPGASSDWAHDYARALIEHAVLTPCWLPAVTGPAPLAAAVRALAEHSASWPLARMLEHTQARLEQLDGEALGQNLAGLRDVARGLGETAASLGFECAGALQADLIKPAPGLSLGAAVVERLLAAARLIVRTGEPEPDDDLDEFCRRFADRYGERWVPLVEALDGDLGIGFGSAQRRGCDALVHGLGLDPGKPAPPRQSELDEWRLSLLAQASRSGSFEVAVDAAPPLTTRPPPGIDALPESFAVLAQLGCRDGRIQIVDPVLLAPSAVATLTRFCHAQPELGRAVSELAALEQARAGDRLLADVAYRPGGNASNIVSRPALRALEIVCGGKSGASEERQLSLSDLHVGLVDGRPQLHSRRLRRQIAIRIANAHEHGAWQNLPIYRFLGALESADRSALPASWSWGALEASPFLPRVVHGDVVLSRARWWLGVAECAALAGLEAAAAFEWVQGLRERLRLPRWVLLSRGETPLVTDLDSILGVEGLVRALRGSPRVLLEELLPAPEELALSGPEGKFAGEVVVPFVLRRPLTRATPRAPDLEPRSPSVRSFAPGSEWLYAKIYAGPSSLDALAQRVTLDLVPRLPSGTLTQWFFVPHADPEAHLRVRFRGESSLLWARVLPELERLLAPHRESGTFYRLVLDTYDRELERYGGVLGIELAERVFHRDSEASGRVLALCAERAELRWCLALLGVERLLADFAPELSERTELAAAFSARYRREFGVGVDTLAAIGARYRARADRLSALLWSDRPGGPHRDEIERARAIYAQRSLDLCPIRERIEASLAAGEIAAARHDLILSFVHLHVVRMLGARARAHELVLYDFLRRQYAACRARFSGPLRAKVG